MTSPVTKASTMPILTDITPIDPGRATRDFYVRALTILDEAAIPYVVGGGYAMAAYTGIQQRTKDLDLFLKPSDHRRALDALAQAGYRTEYFYPFWIAKALEGEAFIDIIYNSANGICEVDDLWLAHAHPIEVHGYRTRLCPAEEQLWSKAFVQDRDRFDGADIAHLILRQGRGFDWQRLVNRFLDHEPVLLAHLLMFDYIYPSQRGCIPDWVMEHLHLRSPRRPTAQKICRGTNVCQRGFLVDIYEWGYRDARLQPIGKLTPEQRAQLPKE